MSKDKNLPATNNGQETAVAVSTMADVTKYNAISRGERGVDILRENLGGDKLSEKHFGKINVPGGGGTMWKLPNPQGGKPVMAEEFAGVILHAQQVRAYWKTELSSSGAQAPDCHSPDGIFGIGEPGGDCLTCQMSQFGSGKNNSQACGENRNLYILREGSSLPTILKIPAMSIDVYKSYIANLPSYKYEIETIFFLSEAVSKGGITYSQVCFRQGAPFDNATVEKIKSYKDAFVATITGGERPNAESGASAQQAA